MTQTHNSTLQNIYIYMYLQKPRPQASVLQPGSGPRALGPGRRCGLAEALGLPLLPSDVHPRRQEAAPGTSAESHQANASASRRRRAHHVHAGNIPGTLHHWLWQPGARVGLGGRSTCMDEGLVRHTEEACAPPRQLPGCGPGHQAARGCCAL